MSTINSFTSTDNFSINYTPTDPLKPANQQVSLSVGPAWTVGSGANQVNKFFEKQYTISASGTQTIDLSAAVTDPGGDSITFTAVKYVRVWMPTDATKSNNVKVDGTVLNSLTTLSGPVLQGGMGLKTENPTAGGWAVGGSNKLITIDNNDGSLSAVVNVFIGGI